MADLPSAEELKGLIGLLAPGFLILSVKDRVSSGPIPKFTERLISYGIASSIYYAIAKPLFSFKGGLTLPSAWIDLLQYFFDPLLVGIAYAYIAQDGNIYALAKRIGIKLAHPIPAAWDYMFSSLRAGTYVLVTMNDGSEIPGLMGEASFASSNPDERDLLIEEVWEIDLAGSWKRMQPVRSILLCGKDIRTVEIF